ncbi:MAG: glycerophosphodiester phosphodiesterase [Acidobacteriota bacterium]
MAVRTASLFAFFLMNAYAGSQILVHGHRGARAVRPENTMPAFEYAIGIGVDVLELDVAVTKDNVLVASHDPHMNPAICTAPAGWKGPDVIREMTLAELRQWDCGAKKNPQFPRQEPVPGTKVPTLDEVFALAPRGTFEFNVETKIFPKKPELTPPAEEFARLLLAAIRKHKLEKRVIVQSFDFRTLTAMKALAPEVRLSALFEPFGSWDTVKAAVEAGAQIISPHYRLVTNAYVERAHKAGLQVVPWTANEEDLWRKLVDAKVDAIISDDPAALLAWLKR